MKKLSYFLSGVLATVLVLALMLPALAASGLTITVNTDMQIKVNGQVFKPKDAAGKDALIFEYNGTTYAPLRALAEAYGLEVGYDQDSRMATVGEPGTTGTPSVTPPPSAERQLPFGTYEVVEISLIKMDGHYYKLNGSYPTAAVYPNVNGKQMIFSESIRVEYVANNGQILYYYPAGFSSIMRLVLLEDYTITESENPFVDGSLTIVEPDSRFRGYISAGRDEKQYVDAATTVTPEWIEYNGIRLYAPPKPKYHGEIRFVDDLIYKGNSIYMDDLLSALGIDKHVYIGKYEGAWYVEIT